MAILHISGSKLYVSYAFLSPYTLCYHHPLTYRSSGIFAIARTAEISQTGGVSVYTDSYVSAQVLAV